MTLDRTMIEVDERAVRRVAARLAALKMGPGGFLPEVPEDREARALLANYWFFLVAMCQHTASLQGTIDGRRLRGWDYLEASSRRRMDLFTAPRLAELTSGELQAVLADHFDPASSTLDRVEERLGQLHQCANRLLSDYGGDVDEVYRHCRGRLAGEGGLLDTLARFEPYRDPIRKKSFLLLMMLSAAGIWVLEDIEALRVPVDYHVMRVALRSGIVRVTDPRLARMLKEREPASEETDVLVRTRVEGACDLLVKASGKSVFEVDMVLWHVGRSCCFYSHEPHCSRCPSTRQCALPKALGYDCRDACLLDGACLGSADAEQRAYWETNIYTSYY